MGYAPRQPLADASWRLALIAYPYWGKPDILTNMANSRQARACWTMYA